MEHYDTSFYLYNPCTESILLFSIGSNGKLKLEQELKGVYLMGKEVRKNLSEAGQEVKIKSYLISILQLSFDLDTKRFL